MNSPTAGDEGCTGDVTAIFRVDVLTFAERREDRARARHDALDQAASFKSTRGGAAVCSWRSMASSA